MMHYDETTIELYVLNAPSVDPQRPEIEAHLAECAGCKELYDTIAEFYTELKADLEASENLPVVIPSALPVRVQQDLQKRISDYIMRPEVKLALPFRAARWVMRHPYASGTGATMFSALLIASLVNTFKAPAIKPRDLNPTHAEFKGEMMLIENKYGEQIDAINIGRDLCESFEQMRRNSRGIPVAFYDVDKDGLNEIIWAHAAESKTGNTSRDASIVSCRSIMKDQTLWSDTLELELDYPLKDEHYQNNFVARQIRVDDFDHDGTPEVFMLSVHTAMFPSVVFKLDATNGRKTDAYIHPGHLQDMKFVDMNNDGITDLILSGVSNSYKNACVVILDPRFMSGQSPTPPEYQAIGYPHANELAYIRIPKTILGETIQSASESNLAGYIQIYENTKSFRVDVGDASTDKYVPSLQYEFGFDLSIVSIHTGDTYDKMAKELYRDGHLRRFPDPKYFEQFKQKIMYWDGEKFVNHPTLNKRYLEAVAKLKPPA